MDEELHRWISENLFDEVPVSICAIDRNYHIVGANRNFLRVFGGREGELCHRAYKDREEPCPHCAARETFADGRLRTREEEGRDPAGRPVHYLVQMVPVGKNGAVNWVVEMSTDITPVKALEREMREATRLAAVGETVAGIAHGIKNVIMGLEGGIYVVNSGTARGDDARIARGWTMVEENTRRITRFVKDFLEFARGRKLQTKLLDPSQPAREALELFRERAAAQGTALQAALDENLAPAPLDGQGLRDALANLLANALDACALNEAGKSGQRVRLELREEQDTLVYEVSDTGRGMDAEISRKIFSTFFSTKGVDQGTGLGLLTTRKIVGSHGGRVSFSTAEGRGSTFRLELPRRLLPAVSEGKD